MSVDVFLRAAKQHAEIRHESARLWYNDILTTLPSTENARHPMKFYIALLFTPGKKNSVSPVNEVFEDVEAAQRSAADNAAIVTASLGRLTKAKVVECDLAKGICTEIK